MRLERDFEGGKKPTVSAKPDAPMPLHAFVFGPMSSSHVDYWANLYRLAYERTIAVFQPTLYDHAMEASAN